MYNLVHIIYENMGIKYDMTYIYGDRVYVSVL